MRTEKVCSIEPPTKGIDGARPRCSAAQVPLSPGSKKVFKHSMLWSGQPNISSKEFTVGLGPQRAVEDDATDRGVARCASNVRAGSGTGTVLALGAGARLPTGLDDELAPDTNGIA